MLLGPQFYRDCWNYVRSINTKHEKNIHFAIQTNLLLYKTSVWKTVFKECFQGWISTSFDLHNTERFLKGSVSSYSSTFLNRLNMLLEDGGRPMVISTFTNSSITDAMDLYEFSASSKIPFDIRFNYRYPAGRAKSTSLDLLSPLAYGTMLVELYNRWIIDLPDFRITPLDQMLELVMNPGINRCPWTNSCNQSFLGIEPNGDLYNCSDFAYLESERYCFGNIFEQSVRLEPSVIAHSSSKMFYQNIHSTPASRNHLLRSVRYGSECYRCDHVAECKGGCMRDSVLFDRGLYGTFYYCESWKLVFSRIKESVSSGEATAAIAKYGIQCARPSVSCAQCHV